MTTKRTWVLGFLLASLPFSVNIDNLTDAPYVFLTGFSEHELVEMAYLPEQELEERIGFSGVPTAFTQNRTQRDRAAHAIASYLGTLRWGPDLTLAFGYMREYVPWVLRGKEADPMDIAANYAGVAEALRGAERRQ
ncbi:MAG: hypothetical protein BMS9Abin37_0823 [Acidobacteriota bacterium]|nr:MAG: hypothetical protein BMS9Abin37_0823 [Acidobacteriota bacterium]